MEWRDEGIIINARKHGETSVILELMTRGHGRHLGLVRGGRGKRFSAVLQPGNSVEAVWRARLDEQLGTYVVEAGRARAGRIMASAPALLAMTWLGAMLRCLPERDPHEGLYEALLLVADHLDAPALAPALIVRFELEVLKSLGFSLDLSECAATGATEDLPWVSPKSGRAVGREAGEPYRGRLLALPSFLRQTGLRAAPDLAEIKAGFALTGHFLASNVFEPRGGGALAARDAYLAEIAKGAALSARS
jgi:DNA repair protein RecO (recombination protein O)